MSRRLTPPVRLILLTSAMLIFGPACAKGAGCSRATTASGLGTTTAKVGGGVGGASTTERAGSGAGSALAVVDDAGAPSPAPIVHDDGGTPIRLRTLAIGRAHTCAIQRGGSVWCWGRNAEGQLGDGTLVGGPIPRPVPQLNGVTSVAAGETHTCAVEKSGLVFCWGENSVGQLGDGTTIRRLLPARALRIEDAVEVAASYETTCARLRTGKVACWGGYRHYQESVSWVGITAMAAAPVTVPGIEDADSLVVHGDEVCVRGADRRSTCWRPGWDGPSDAVNLARDGWWLSPGHPSEERVTGAALDCSVVEGGWASCNSSVSGVVSIVSSGFRGSRPHVCVLFAAGTVSCGPSLERLDPVRGLRGAIEIADGPTSYASVGVVRHACARFADGSITCWGQNSEGQLGGGTTDGDNLRSEPMEVPGLRGVREIVAERNQTCARLADHTVWCWGEGASNPARVPAFKAVERLLSPHAALLARGDVAVIGPKSVQEYSDGTARLIAELSGALEVVAHDGGRGAGIVCARSEKGTVSCWTRGVEAYGVVHGVHEVQAVQGLEGVTHLTIGPDAVCGHFADGRVKCWGLSRSGRLGVGDAHSWGKLERAIEVPALRGVTALAIGESRSCAAHRDGTVICMGSGFGTFGTNATFQPTPAPIAGLSNVVDLSLGHEHSCARHEDGTVSCWGWNDRGQLGDGTTHQRMLPVSVLRLSGVRQIASGARHTCVLKEDSSVACWGDNWAGQLGVPVVQVSSGPIAVKAR